MVHNSHYGLAGLIGMLLVLAASTGHAQLNTAMNELAERYVKLVLAMGQHDPDYVDAYYGPDVWRIEAETSAQTLIQIGVAAEAALAELQQIAPDGTELGQLRHRYLQRQLEALRVRVHMLEGEALSFDDESAALYDAVAPSHQESYFQQTLAKLEQALPGDGALTDRYAAFRDDFIIDPDKLTSVFDIAIAECRRRTVAHIDLPASERFTVEYVTDKSWSGYNWYQGDFRSLIQVNTDLPIYIDRAIDLACHEGYPGHHVYNVLLERHLVREQGWPEFSVYALFSPQSLIAEGTANHGIDVAFPAKQRLTFEQTVLFPAAGLAGSRAAQYYGVQSLVAQLDYAGNEAARRYLNGQFDRGDAARWLTRYALMTPARAQQRVRFFDQYRSYVINYNLGEDLVAAFIDAQSRGMAANRWNVFAKLLASPRLPSGLRD
ncbi:MAG: hypothetical protein VX453_10880 [Acidobacteriota bacterium]|nr:hypothetical protein [Acidobacteriota bacterium]